MRSSGLQTAKSGLVLKYAIKCRDGVIHGLVHFTLAVGLVRKINRGCAGGLAEYLEFILHLTPFGLQRHDEAFQLFLSLSALGNGLLEYRELRFDVELMRDCRLGEIIAPFCNCNLDACRQFFVPGVLFRQTLVGQMLGGDRLAKFTPDLIHRTVNLSNCLFHNHFRSDIFDGINKCVHATTDYTPDALCKTFSHYSSP